MYKSKKKRNDLRRERLWNRVLKRDREGGKERRKEKRGNVISFRKMIVVNCISCLGCGEGMNCYFLLVAALLFLSLPLRLLIMIIIITFPSSRWSGYTLEADRDEMNVLTFVFDLDAPSNPQNLSLSLTLRNLWLLFYPYFLWFDVL